MTSYTIFKWPAERSAPGDDSLVPEGRIINVSFDFVLPGTATRLQVEEWLDLFLGIGGMRNDNPLSRTEPEAVSRPVLTDTGYDSDFFTKRDQALGIAR